MKLKSPEVANTLQIKKQFIINPIFTRQQHHAMMIMDPKPKTLFSKTNSLASRHKGKLVSTDWSAMVNSFRVAHFIISSDAEL